MSHPSLVSLPAWLHCMVLISPKTEFLLWFVPFSWQLAVVGSDWAAL